MVPGIERCQDGYVGLATITVQQWHDVLAMIERTDLMATAPSGTIRRSASASRHGQGRDRPVVPRQHTAEECSSWPRPSGCRPRPSRPAPRSPAAPVVARGLFRPNPRGFPRSPAAVPQQPDSAAAGRAGPASGGARGGAIRRTRRPAAGRVESVTTSELPLEGVRIVDLTAFWAGPFGTQYLATLGADVIKVESVQRPDPMRFSVTVPPTTEQWYEQGSLFVAINLNKRGITLDLSRPEGRDLLLRLVATADVVVENFTPRVMEHFGLTYDAACGRSDRTSSWCACRAGDSKVPGATGRPSPPPWSRCRGWPGLPAGPTVPRCCRVSAIRWPGSMRAFAVLAALEQRRRTGEGQQVELAMLDMAVNVAVEQVLEYAAYGH